MKIIGLSLSFCIRDINKMMKSPDDYEVMVITEKGAVSRKLSDYSNFHILSGVRCYIRDDWDVVLELYKKSYWLDDPDGCMAIFWEMMNRDLIEQPRITASKYPMINKGHWVENHNLIEWAGDI